MAEFFFFVLDHQHETLRPVLTFQRLNENIKPIIWLQKKEKKTCILHRLCQTYKQ